MARTEKTGKVQKKWPMKFLVNDAPKYFICSECGKLEFFATQTDAFRVAMPKQLAVYRIVDELNYTKVELRPQVLTLVQQKVKKENLTPANGRWNNSWTTRKSGSKRIKKSSSRHIKFTK
jgi:hypothetical protein